MVISPSNHWHIFISSLNHQHFHFTTKPPTFSFHHQTTDIFSFHHQTTNIFSFHHQTTDIFQTINNMVAFLLFPSLDQLIVVFVFCLFAAITSCYVCNSFNSSRPPGSLAKVWRISASSILFKNSYHAAIWSKRTLSSWHKMEGFSFSFHQVHFFLFFPSSSLCHGLVICTRLDALAATYIPVASLHEY